MELPFQVEEILARLENAGFEAYVVGGCVRDFLMGKNPHDFDITTSALPTEVESVFSDCRIVETGIKHGTVTVLYRGISTEITVFRTDGEYSDGRHPDSVTFSRNVTDDLSRRDFTMNGIAYNPRRGYIDPFGGEEDIKNGIIRCIGEPDRRFGEDALRVLRALRFSSVLNFKIEENTAKSVLNCKNALKKVSEERIFSELKRQLCGDNVKRVLLDFAEVFAEIIPQTAPAIGYEQCSKYHDSTLWEHTARAVEAAPPEVHIRLAMLFHDLGKPQCRTRDENGECHYYAHAELSAQMADEILRKFKCDNLTRERVVEIVRFHGLPCDTPTKKFVKRQLSRHGLEVFRDIMLANIADNSAKRDFCRDRIPNIRECIRIAEELAAGEECTSMKKLAVTGRDLSKLTKPSPLMGKVLSALLDEVLDEKLPNEKPALMKRAGELIEELSPDSD